MAFNLKRSLRSPEVETTKGAVLPAPLHQPAM